MIDKILFYFNILLFSKCPHCHKHGIFFLKLNLRSDGIQKCKYCNGSVYVHSGITSVCICIIFIILFFIYKTIFSNILSNNLFKTLGYVWGIAFLYFAEYFAYVEKIDDNKDSTE